MISTLLELRKKKLFLFYFCLAKIKLNNNNKMKEKLWNLFEQQHYNYSFPEPFNLVLENIYFQFCLVAKQQIAFPWRLRLCFCEHYNLLLLRYMLQNKVSQRKGNFYFNLVWCWIIFVWFLAIANHIWMFTIIWILSFIIFVLCCCSIFDVVVVQKLICQIVKVRIRMIHPFISRFGRGRYI